MTAVIVLAALPLVAMVAVLAIAVGSPGAIVGALLAGCSSLALAVLLAGMADRKLAREAWQKAQAAESASRSKDEFLALLSHELRNPLGALSAAVDVLESAGGDDESAADARSIIARQTRSLSLMLNELLDVSRLLAGRAVLERQPLDLAALAQRVQQTVALTGAAAGHRLSCRLDSAWTDGDATRLEQVVSRLLTDALRCTPPGGDVVLSVRRVGGEATVQVHGGGDRMPAGQSIGFTLARRLVELHGGTLEVETSPAGNLLTVRLLAAEPVIPPDEDAWPLQRRRKVLVMEDNEEVLAALRAVLELDGHKVSTAADAREGLSRLLLERPDVSIVAVGLPGLAAFELALHARAAGYAGRMIALSGRGDERDAANAIAAGFDDWLVTPVDRVKLRASFGGA